MKPVPTPLVPDVIKKSPPTRIYLTGFMGSGKSTVGRHLANVLAYSFADLDTLIEQAAGCSIPALFETQGEAAFRALEATQLRATEAEERAVIALGGGALTFEENLSWARAHGTVIYLRVPIEVLLKRLLNERQGRPMLYDADGKPHAPETLHAHIADLLEKRAPFYERAHVTVEAAGKPDQVVGLMVDALEQL